MKKYARAFLAFCLVVLTVVGMSVTLFGASAASANGWSTDSDGVERYYVGGSYVTGRRTIGNHTYLFDDDGALIRLVDDHQNVGEYGTLDTDAYKNAISALGDKVYLAIPITSQSKLGNGKTMASGLRLGSLDSETSCTLRNNASDSTQLKIVTKKTYAEIISKGDDGDLAIQLWQSSAGVDPFINVDAKTCEAGEDMVVDFEIKIGEGLNLPDNRSVTFLSVIDRDVKADGATSNNVELLHLTSEGMVYSKKYSTTKYVCKLSEDSYTRISAVVHPQADTFDIYVGGVKVLDGVSLGCSSAEWYDGTKAKFDEFRIAQMSHLTEDYGLSVCVDNVYVYGASAPVCTVEADARNGVYASGAYLRHYEDNLITKGRATLNGTFFGHTFSNESVSFDSHGKYFVGCTASMVIGTTAGKAEMVDGNLFVAPDAVDVEGEIFVGWKVTNPDGTTKFLYPGQTMRLSGNVKYEPVSVKYELLDGASVRTVVDSTGLRFMARIDRNDYTMLKALGLTVEMHMMIIPTEYIEKTYGYTTVEAFDELAKEGYASKIDVAPNAWYYQTDNYYYYVGSVSNILSENYMLDYSAVGYLKITDGSGRTERIYTSYDEENNSRSVYEVASRAYNDRASSAKKTYTNKVQYGGKNTYSPYDSTKLGVIKSFVDKVVMIDVDDNGVHASGEYYDAPYTINAVNNDGNYTVTVSDKGDWKVSASVGIALNGKKLAEDEYTQSATSYVIGVSDGVTDLKDVASNHVNKWYMVKAGKDSSLTNFSAATLPNAAPNGEVSGFKWFFGGTESTFTTANLYNSGANFGWTLDGSARKYSRSYNSTNGNYAIDMSDWQTLTFYYYAPEGAVGNKFMLYFNSANPSTTSTDANGKTTDAADYYSYTVTVKQAGWNKVFIKKSGMGITRSPLGWDKIDTIRLVNHGWDMEKVNNYDVSLYFTSFVFGDSTYDVGVDKEMAAFYPGGYAAIVNSKKYVINDNDKVNALTFKDGDTYYLPLSVLASGLAESASYYDGGNVLNMTMGGVSYRFTEGKTYVKGSETVSLSKEAVVKGNRLFVSAEDVMTIFGYTEKYIDRMGLIVLSNTADIFDPDDDYDVIYTLIEECAYVRPTGEQVADDLIACSGGVHPYIMLDQSDFNRLNYYKNKEATLRQYISNLAVKYDVGGTVYVKDPVQYSLTDGVRLLAISREAMERTRSFALLYKLYEKDDPEKAEQLAERLWSELESVCTFKDWHPSHYLDTAEMAYAVAIGYDWLYDYWVAYDEANGTSRIETIENALYEFSLRTTSVVDGGTYDYNLAGASNNWNGVCNGGTMTAALALITSENSTYREAAIKVIDASILAVEKGMWVYAPDGGYEEGPGYWAYGSTYLSVYMSALDSACGTNYGLYYAPGFAHSVYFTTYLGTVNSAWGFHDGGTGSADTSIAAWFAKKSNDGNVNAIRRQAIENGWKSSSWYDIVWFSPTIVNNTITLGLDSYYSLDTIITFRDSWDEKNTLFAGFHGGSNSASHGDLDIGNFVIAVDGNYIICDLGPEAYNVAGYFGNYRWSYYRKRAEGQNTLVMLPHGESWNGTTGIPYADPTTNKETDTNKPTPDQVSSAVAECIRYESGTSSALAVIDMTEAYASYISSESKAIRGLWFKDDRSTIVIQDEGKYNQGMDIWWFAHTQGNITISEDGKSAVIEQNGIYLYAELVTDIENAKFEAMAAESLDEDYVGDTSHPNDNFKDDVEKSRANIRKLCVKAEDVTEYKLAVVFKVISGKDDVPTFGTTYAWTDIENWVAE